jgi:hypothetical protein
MRFTIETDGTAEGTSFEFRMTADEIPRMLERRRQRVLRNRVVPDYPGPDLSPDDAVDEVGTTFEH